MAEVDQLALPLGEAPLLDPCAVAPLGERALPLGQLALPLGDSADALLERRELRGDVRAPRRERRERAVERAVQLSLDRSQLGDLPLSFPELRLGLVEGGALRLQFGGPVADRPRSSSPAALRSR